ncbi:unnamed protein product [Cuscuta epithymum]|uniref:Palmitoyl-protein thioesterase n=1 Tax=Cuscuta epithymum TaxID=186058 RepID=A0AAV0GDK4_9ASTE|nr:unnamed protein product [Cuscuta epithymum]
MDQSMANRFSLPISFSHTIFVLQLIVFSFIPFSSSTPFIVLHGISMACVDGGSTYYTMTLSSMTKVKGQCVEVGNGLFDSWMMPMNKQVADACGKVKRMPELKGGYNMVALSQGNMVGRGVIEECDGPPVKNFISVGGPDAGHASTYPCGKFPWCNTIGHFYGMGVYNDFAQTHLAPSGYIKIPSDIPGYLKGCRYLPRLNNEIKDKDSALRKKKFSSLERLVLVLFQADTIILPQESSWFGYYPNGDFSKAVPMQQTDVYKKDLFGLQTLDKAKKIKFFKVPGFHLGITPPEIQKYMVPYMT